MEDHRRFLARRTELLDLRHDALPVRVAERRVVDHDVLVLDALRLQVRLEDLVRGSGVHIVGPSQYPAFDLDVIHQVVDCRDGLLIRRGTCVDDILGRLFTFVLHGIEEQPVVLFEHRQHRLAGHGCPTAEHHGYLVLFQQLGGFFREQRPVGGRIDPPRPRAVCRARPPSCSAHR